jgi:hypothetical protein
MPNFSTDADLLTCEPNVFVDLPLPSQQKLKVTDAALAGVTVTTATGGFAELAAGDVAVISSTEADAAAFAIASIDDDSTITLEHAPTHLSANTDLTLIVRTFEPQRQQVHEQLMRCVGIDPDGDDLDESAIVSMGLMRRLEVLGTLWRAYSAAHTLTGDNITVEAKAAQYARHFNRALAGAVVLIDTNGDGVADVQRTPGAGRLVRA